jgi:hypothetical protein
LAFVVSRSGQGSGFVWAVVIFFAWTDRHCVIPVLIAGVAFQALTEVVHRLPKQKSCTPDEIAALVRRPKGSSAPKIDFDKPVVSWEEDAVGRQGFVEEILTRVLLDNEPALGITAEFGEGKSPVLNLIRISIERGDRAIVVPFRTWLPGSERTLLDSLFSTATATVEKKFFLPPWRSTSAKYGRVVFGAVPSSWSFVRDLLPPESQLHQIEQLASVFARLPVRIVLGILRLRMTSTSWTSCFAQDDKYVLMQTYLESGDSSSSSNPSGS